MNARKRLRVILAIPGCSGFTIIEVLVALLVLSVGLLGLAALQATGLRYNHSAYLRSQAVVQVYDMADRMRANLPGVQAGAYSNLSGIPTSYTSGSINCVGNSSSNNCVAADMAQFDLGQWNTANGGLLPGGAGKVGIAAGGGADCANANAVCTITVSWNEIEGGVPVAKSFSTTIQPFSVP